MQIYTSPGGSKYLVFRGEVYYQPSAGGEPRMSSMTVARFLELISHGVMLFSHTVNPALAYRAEHWNSTKS